MTDGDRVGSGAIQPGPAELAAQLDRVMACAQGLIAAVPAPYVEHRVSGNGSTIRETAYAVFRLSQAFADGMDLGRLFDSWLGAGVPAELRDGGDVARYGALVRGRLAGWFEGAAPSEYARVIETPAGPVSGGELLDRITREATSQLRRLTAMLADIGIQP